MRNILSWTSGNGTITALHCSVFCRVQFFECNFYGGCSCEYPHFIKHSCVVFIMQQKKKKTYTILWSLMGARGFGLYNWIREENCLYEKWN